jgi:hypothetical protein
MPDTNDNSNSPASGAAGGYAATRKELQNVVDDLRAIQTALRKGQADKAFTIARNSQTSVINFLADNADAA